MEHIYTPSQYYANYFSDQLNLKIKYAHLGVNLNDFPYKEKDNQLKKDFNEIRKK